MFSKLFIPGVILSWIRRLFTFRQSSLTIPTICRVTCSQIDYCDGISHLRDSYCWCFLLLKLQHVFSVRRKRSSGQSDRPTLGYPRLKLETRHWLQLAWIAQGTSHRIPLWLLQFPIYINLEDWQLTSQPLLGMGMRDLLSCLLITR